MINLKILSENRENCKFKGEPGLSVLVDAFENKFLLDTGHSNLFIKNAKLLKLDIEEIEKIIITHGHDDHSGGLEFLQTPKTIIMHPLAYKSRWSIRRKEFVGFPLSEQELTKKHKVLKTKEEIEFYDNCWFLGEIPMRIEFEKDGNFSTMLDEELTQTDFTEDDSGVAITTEKGLFVMTGCGHRGICNTIEKAKKVTGQNKVYGVLGGFHLRDLENQKSKIDATIKYFKQNDVQELFLGHCVKDEVIDYFEQKLKKVKITRLAAGKEISIDLKPFI